MVGAVEQRIGHPHRIGKRRQRSGGARHGRNAKAPAARRIDSPAKIDSELAQLEHACPSAAAVPSRTQAPRTRLVLHPTLGPPEGVDLTEAIIGAVAAELWKRFGGNDVVNWLEAERLVLNSFASE